MWSFEDSGFDFDANKTQQPIEWKAFAPPITDRSRLNAAKRSRTRKCRSPRGKDRAPSSDREVGDEAGKTPKADAKGNELTLGIHNRAEETQMLDAEDDEGNIEYKLKLKQNNATRFQQLAQAVEGILREEEFAGVEDDGYVRGLSDWDLDTSFQTLKAMASKVNATVISQRKLPALKGRQYMIAEVSRVCQQQLMYQDICVAVAGCEDSGKSTLVAILSNGQNGVPVLDNGNGSARMSTFRHIHEIESGKTSSLGHHSVAYDSSGRVLNYAGTNAPWSPEEIANAADCVLQLVDLGGSRKSLKTAFYGLTALLPKLVLLCVNPSDGFTDVTRQHMAVALALQIPVAVVITKIDKASEGMLANTEAQLEEVLSSGFSLQSTDQPVEITHITSEQEAAEVAQHMHIFESSPCLVLPVLKVNNISGKGLMLLHTFLSKLHSSPPDAQPSTSAGASKSSSVDMEHVHFLADDLFDVKGAGQGNFWFWQSGVKEYCAVASGILVKGRIEVGQTLMLGPTAKANFRRVIVKSIERAQVPVMKLQAGQVATLLYKTEKEEPSRDARGKRLQTSLGKLQRSSVDSQTAAEPGLLSLSDELAQIRFTEGLAASPEPGSDIRSSEEMEQAARPAAQQGLKAAEQMLQQHSEPEAASSVSGELEMRSNGAMTDRRHDEWQSQQSTRLQMADTGPLMSRPEAGSDSDGAMPTPAPSSNRVQRSLLAGLSEENAAAISVGGSVPESGSSTNFRKGTVFIDTCLEPSAAWEFEAVMVVFGGFWPPRGLLSGSWPFCLDTEADLGTSSGTSPNMQLSLDAPSGSLGRSPRSRSFRRSTRGIYTPMIHCNNVRQAAKVIYMQEESLPEPWTAEDVIQTTGIDMRPALSAAMSLSASTNEHVEPEICVAQLRFRFLHEPAWMDIGSKLVARDRTESCLSGAGIVTKVFSN